MRKILIPTLLASAVYCLSVFAVSELFTLRGNSLEEGVKVVNVLDLTDQHLTELMKGHYPAVAVEFSVGTILPLHLLLKGDLVNLIENEKSFGQLEIKQTFYARCVQEGLMLSANLIEWKPLLEFVTGTVSVQLSIQEGQASFAVGTEANCKG